MIEDTSRMDRSLAPDRPHRWRLLVVSVVAVILGALLVRPAVGRWLHAQQSIDRSRLRLANVLRGELVHDVAVQGRVVAASRSTLFSPARGTVSLRVREGAAVAAGQVLAVVASPELGNLLQQEQTTVDAARSEIGRQELLSRRSNLENQQQADLAGVRAAAARRELVRKEEMSRLGLIDQAELMKARDELQMAELELDHAKQKVVLERDVLAFELRDARLRFDRQLLVVEEVRRRIDELAIVAPFAGQVAALDVDDRDAVVSGQALLGIVNLSDLEVEVNIPEAFADDVAVGVEGVITIDGRKYRGRLTQVAPEVRANQVTGRVAFAGGTPDGLRQNQRLNTRLILARRRDVLKVPRGPFLEGGGGRSIYVVTDGLARRRAMDIGVVSVTEVEIVTGLEEGETVVLSDLTRFDEAKAILLRN